MRLFGLAALLVLVAGAAHAATITFPSLDATATPINAEFFVPESSDSPKTGPHPAAVLIHGCGGLWTRRGEMNPRQRQLAKRLVDRGYVVLLPDSFRSRGEEEVCSQRLRDRPVDLGKRRGDALGALAWLRARPDVDPGRIVAIGWSHGGSTVLNATNRLSKTVVESGLTFKAAIAFYPGCVDGRAAGKYAPISPILILMGASDDWTLPARCQELADEMTAAHEPFELVLYPGAYHGFDTPGDFHTTRQVQGGTRTVTQATDPAARADAAKRLDKFLMEQVGQ